MKKSALFSTKLNLYLKKKLMKWGYLFIKEPHPEKWVFIIACTNSGTTLLQEILSFHPSIGTMPLEGQAYTDEFPIPQDYGVPRLWTFKPEIFRLNENDGAHINVRKVKKQWAFAYNDPHRPILLEKTIANGARVRWLDKHFQNSYFIALIRNGYAVAEGIRRKANHPLDKCIKQWKLSNEIMLSDLEFVERKILIKYEDLAENTASVVNKICDFLDINPINENSFGGKDFLIHGTQSTIKNMNNISISKLNPDEIKLINKHAASTLSRFDYQII